MRASIKPNRGKGQHAAGADPRLETLRTTSRTSSLASSVAVKSVSARVESELVVTLRGVDLASRCGGVENAEH